MKKHNCECTISTTKRGVSGGFGGRERSVKAGGLSMEGPSSVSLGDDAQEVGPGDDLT